MIIKNNKKIFKIYDGEKLVDRIFKGMTKVYEYLPVGYKECKYLESTGTQYIDTLYKPNSNTKIELEYIPTSSYSGFMTIYGTQNNTSSGRFYGLVSGTPYYLQINFSNNSSPSVWGFNKNGTVNLDNNGTFSPTLQRVKLSVDNRSVRIESPEYSNTYNMTGYRTWGNRVNCNYNLTIFARSTAGVVSNNFSGKIYYFKIYDNGNIVRDYIPVIDSSNRPCLYDKVEKKCYYNQGSGEFLYELL